MNLLLDRTSFGKEARVMKPVPLSGPPPRVTVVVPCYNYGRYLSDCLGSILAQPGVDVDVVLVDDASTDGSGDVAEQLAGMDPRITLVRHARNAGHIATYNDGLDRAEGDYLVLLSADDLLAPGSLSRSTALLEANPSVGISYGRTVIFSGDSPSSSVQALRSWTIWPGESWLRMRWEKARNCVWNPEIVIRATVQREIGGYRSHLPMAADFAMWMRAASVADVGHVDGPDQGFYRMHGDNMHLTTFEDGRSSEVLIDLNERRLTFENLALEIPGGPELLPEACKGLAVEALTVATRLFSQPTVDRGLVESLVAFATDVYPASTGLPQWRSTQRRLTMDPAAVRRNLGFRAQEMVEKGKETARQWRWRRIGV